MPSGADRFIGDAVSCAQDEVFEDITLSTLPDDVNMARLLGCLKQVAALADHATGIFTNLTYCATGMFSRLDEAVKKTDSLRNKLLPDALRRVKYMDVGSGHSGKKARQRYLGERDPYIPPVLTRESLPSYVADTYESCKPLPAFSSMQTILKRDCSTKYSDPGFFFSEWARQETKKQDDIRKLKKKIKKMKKLMKSEAKTKTNLITGKGARQLLLEKLKDGIADSQAAEKEEMRAVAPMDVAEAAPSAKEARRQSVAKQQKGALSKLSSFLFKPVKSSQSDDSVSQQPPSVEKPPSEEGQSESSEEDEDEEEDEEEEDDKSTGSPPSLPASVESSLPPPPDDLSEPPTPDGPPSPEGPPSPPAKEGPAASADDVEDAIRAEAKVISRRKSVVRAAPGGAPKKLLPSVPGRRRASLAAVHRDFLEMPEKESVMSPVLEEELAALAASAGFVNAEESLVLIARKPSRRASFQFQPSTTARSSAVQKQGSIVKDEASNLIYSKNSMTIAASTPGKLSARALDPKLFLVPPCLMEFLAEPEEHTELVRDRADAPDVNDVQHPSEETEASLRGEEPSVPGRRTSSSSIKVPPPEPRPQMPVPVTPGRPPAPPKSVTPPMGTPPMGTPPMDSPPPPSPDDPPPPPRPPSQPRPPSKDEDDLPPPPDDMFEDEDDLPPPPEPSGPPPSLGMIPKRPTGLLKDIAVKRELNKAPEIMPKRVSTRTKLMGEISDGKAQLRKLKETTVVMTSRGRKSTQNQNSAIKKILENRSRIYGDSDDDSDDDSDGSNDDSLF